MNNNIVNQLRNHQKMLQLQQDFLCNQGKKGFWFYNKPNDYLALVARYNEKTKHSKSGNDRFAILYTLLDGEVETIYNRHLVETEKTVALRRVWLALKNTYG